MAVVYPATLPDYIRRDPLRSSERKVYAALGASLGDGFTLFYSRPWLGLSPTGAEIEGEADFVIAHARYGMLVLEVKGGGVGRDGNDSEWFSIDRDGRRHQIRNPVQQALRSKHRLVDVLRDRRPLRGRFLRAGIGVVLPDSSRDPSIADGIDTPIEVFAFAEDIPRLADWVRGRFGSLGEGAFGEVAVEELTTVLAGRFQLRTALGTAIASDEAAILTLTEQQCQLVDFLADHPRAAIGGAAGSGKTMLAVHKVCQLAAFHPDWRILLCCFNRPLASHLAGLVRDRPNVVVASFHELCGRISAEAGIEPGQGIPDDELYGTRLPEAFADAIARRPDLRFDAIVLDEGQDFADLWIDALQLSLRDPQDGVFWAFFDDNQRIYPRVPQRLKELPQPPFRLTNNVRNTKPIWASALPYVSEPRPGSRGPDGRPVDEIAVGDAAELRRALEATLRNMIEEQGIRPSDVAVLAYDGSDLAAAISGTRLAGLPVVKAEDPREGAIVADTVRRFKGLERPVVVLISGIEAGEPPELAYVAHTRARSHLVVLKRRVLEGVR